jgi:hypothetical protein
VIRKGRSIPKEKIDILRKRIFHSSGFLRNSIQRTYKNANAMKAAPCCFMRKQRPRSNPLVSRVRGFFDSFAETNNRIPPRAGRMTKCSALAKIPCTGCPREKRAKEAAAPSQHS